MDRRTFLKSASMKGTAIVTASAVGTEMLHAAESIGASDVASGKRNAPKAKRLPEDLQELVKDSSLLRKPDNLRTGDFSDNRRRLLDWKNENKTIQFGNRHQCIASRGISGTA